jgi:hypothetical protein
MAKRWIILSFDGLANTALSPYGSSWNETPEFDRLSASGLIWDRVVVPSDQADDTLVRFWNAPLGHSTWVQCWRKVGAVELYLSSRCGQTQGDTGGPSSVESRLTNAANECGIDRCTWVEVDLDQTPADEPESTLLGQQMATLIDRLTEETAETDRNSPWSILWLHSDFLTRHWDAPRSLFPVDETDDWDEETDEEIPAATPEFASKAEQPVASPTGYERPPPLMDTVIPPTLKLDPKGHPDWPITWMQTYGCQVRLIDHWVGILADLIAEDPREIGLAVVGTSGFALGQNAWVGHRMGPLVSPQIQVPAIIHVPKQFPLRCPEVISLNDLAGHLRPPVAEIDPSPSPYPNPTEWAAADALSVAIETISDRVLKAITTREWFFVVDPDEKVRLYLKPDDVNDFNDVANRCHDVVEKFISAGE